MKYNSGSRTKFEANQYEQTLGYLEYGENASDKLSIPIELRERHLTESTRECKVTGIGPELQIAFWSDRDNILLRIPLDDWTQKGVYTNKLTGNNNGLLSVGRFEDELRPVVYEDDGISLKVDALVLTHEWEHPEK